MAQGFPAHPTASRPVGSDLLFSVSRRWRTPGAEGPALIAGLEEAEPGRQELLAPDRCVLTHPTRGSSSPVLT